MPPEQVRPSARYVRACVLLERAALRLRLVKKNGAGSRKVVKERRGEREMMRELEMKLQIAQIGLRPGTVLAAAHAAAFIAMVLAAGIAASTFFLDARWLTVPSLFLAFAAPLLVRQAVLEQPSAAANKRAAEILRGSPSATNLMIMSLRHEPSVSKAIQFVSNGKGGFAKELRGCIWAVLMGRQTSFEESLQALGRKWESYSPELKTSLNAMVTASCEATDDGKRRALDRANHAMVAGAKKRIEEYALSLAAPSMIMFGLGILLPLMVGSFMPMLSWNLWSPQGEFEGGSMDQGETMTQTVFVMNVLFPAVAALVAISAVSRHPLESSGGDFEPRNRRNRGLALVVGVTALLCLLAFLHLGGMVRATALLAAATCPVAIWLVGANRPEDGSGSSSSKSGLEDVLFRLGARMQEGENFESAMNRVGAELDSPVGTSVRRLWLRSNVPGNDFESVADDEAGLHGQRNSLEGLKVVRRAASKDESSAGMLAMDLAAYLRDLNELETGLKNRLKPTISMMRMTAFALGPIVLGITFSIYLSLASMVGDGQGALDPEGFFLTLGLFLVEINVIVVYFVWGIEGGLDRKTLKHSTGLCLLASVLIFAATATVAS